MCGIALIISGIRINLSSLLPNHISPIPHLPPQTLLSVDDIKEALRRRGPDSLGSKSVFIHSKVSSHEQEIVSGIDDLRNESEEREVENDFGDGKLGKLEFIGATLQLRGVDRIVQPLVDASGNVLVYNGEIFGGIDIGSDSNDTEILMQNMGQCCTCNCHEYDTNHYSCGESQNSVPELLSKIKGPWALIYWQDSSKTLWFGRDAFGRRSLLVHWPTTEDPRLLLSSVSPLPSINGNSEFGDAKTMAELDFWEELSCGVYSICMGDDVGIDGGPVGEVKKHQWADPSLQELIRWERSFVQPNPEELYVSREKFSGRQQYFHEIRPIRMHSDSAFPSYLAETVLWPSERLLIALKESVKRRTALSKIYKEAISECSYEGCAPVGVLFSGGLDSMILAALLHQCIDAKYEIELLNVSFDGNCAPDRISARAGAKELEKIAPSRRWKLVEIDSNLLRLTFETKHVMSLINPAKTYMDLNIGIALWLAAGGDGWVYEGESNNNSMDCHRVKYKFTSRILLVGSGADEQCAGYGRHRTKYRHGSWVGLHEEMRLDMQRIWKRNLGRDDRCIADNGKEARFPFLDENVIRLLLDLPLWEIADLDQPSGIGDKKILREVAQLLGLYEAAVLPKRAIQFGSRIARESNRKNFGSNRAANQANAGSVAIYGPSN